jgi:tRNA pseudouridine38-40 synthase
MPISLLVLIHLESAISSCDSRKYTYFFPTHLLIPPKPSSSLGRILSQKSLELGWDGVVNPEHTAFCETHHEPTSDEELKRKRRWRIDEATLAQIRSAATKFEGSHNFHNFTIGKEFREPSCSRYMKRIEARYFI